MQPEFDTAPQGAKQWPDFYSILNSTPETDVDTLRKTINKMYVQANRELDHRELSRRFYYQVLSQKVLPQCRRVLLDKEVRMAYDEQWMLHRDGVAGALSYGEFITGLSKKLNVDSSTLLTDSELAVLPSFEQGSGSVSAPTDFVPATTSAPAKSVSTAPAIKETPVAATASASASTAVSSSPTPIEAPVPKKSNLPLFGGLAVLGVAFAAGGAMWSSSRGSSDQMSTPIVARPKVASAAAPGPNVPLVPVTTETALASPILLTFDSMPGTVTGNVRLGPGLDGQGLVLDGKSKSSVELPQTLDTSKSYTVMTWVKLLQVPDMQKGLTPFETFISADGPAQSAFFLQVRADTQRFGFASLPIKAVPLATFAGDTGAYKVNTWYHIAGVYDAAQRKMSLYINGALRNSVSFTQAYRGSGTLRLGRAKFDGAPVDFMSGTLDNVQIFQKALSAADIAAIVKPLKARAGIQ